jgi:hypothetical protein
MNDTDIAIFLRDQCARRLSGSEWQLVSAIAEGDHLDRNGEWIVPTERRRFEGLKTQFASELARCQPQLETVASNTTPELIP